MLRYELRRPSTLPPDPRQAEAALRRLQKFKLDVDWIKALPGKASSNVVRTMLGRSYMWSQVSGGLSILECPRLHQAT